MVSAVSENDEGNEGDIMDEEPNMVTKNDNDDDDNDDIVENNTKDVSEGDEKMDENLESIGEEIQLGGPIDKPAYALLVGISEETNNDTNNDTTNRTPISIPITTLPAILGRTHPSPSKNFFGLGKVKALSRSHAVIFYRDARGGKIGNYTIQEETCKATTNPNESKNDIIIHDDWVYRPPAKVSDDDDSVIKPDNYKQDKTSSTLPTTGFFAIEALSKNKIMVGGKRVDQGQVAILSHGTTIKMASLSLYFLLPTDCTPQSVTIPLSVTDVASISDGEDLDMTGGTKSIIKSEQKSPSKKKQKKSDIKDSSTSEGGREKVAKLIKEYQHAIDTNTFERKHQMISNTIMLQACKDFGQNEELRELCRQSFGLPRLDIIERIEKDDFYGPWAVHMKERLEFKSYQSNISRCLMKEGYERLGTTGRHVKWLLPGIKKEDCVQEESGDDDADGSNDEEGQGSDDEEGGNS